MSTRLYYTDSYLTAFEAQVVERLTWNERPAVVLDRTAFYPTSGGQPFDTGDIDGAGVVEVAAAADGRIVHVLDREIAGSAPVSCRIDWTRRFDHMQQHTGQHVLSAAFERTRGIHTESFHLGGEGCTIDVSASPGPQEVAAAELEANRTVWQNLAVVTRFVDPDEAKGLPLRKHPPRLGGPLRVIEIEGVDLSACGGTHVARTGEIGLIAIAGFERYKGGTRVEFVCGARALARYRTARDLLAASARHLGCAPHELPANVERLQGETKQQRLQLREQQQQLATLYAADLKAQAEARRDLRVVARHLAGWDAAGMKAIAAAAATDPGYVVVLTGGDPPGVVVACAPGVAVNAAAVIRILTARFGGRGGGRPELAQGGGLTGSPEEILAAAVAALES